MTDNNPRRRGPAFWTPERDLVLEELWPTNVSIDEIARTIGCDPKAAYKHGTDYLGLGPRGHVQVRGGGRDREMSRGEVEAQDEAFRAAMLAAIQGKLEHPSIGIDKRPGTEAPRSMYRGEHDFSVPGSSSAACTDL